MRPSVRSCSSAYEQLVHHAIDGKLTVDLERTPLDDISETWDYLKARSPRKLVLQPEMLGGLPGRSGRCPSRASGMTGALAKVRTIR
jgi:hypothetical protein